MGSQTHWGERMITALEPLGRDALTHDDFTDLVRTITGDPAATPGDVRVEPVDYPIGTPSTEALLRLFGTATSATGDPVPWSCFVKKLQSARHWQFIDMVPDGFRAAFIQNLPWELEIGATVHPYPTQSEAFRKAADAWRRTRLTPRAWSAFRAFFRLIR